MPESAKFLRLKLVDHIVAGFNHGAGVVDWNGGAVIPAGAFKYVQPCPPNGSYSYEWTATAQTKKNGGKLDSAKARRTYPE